MSVLRRIVTHDEDETRILGRALAEIVTPGNVLALVGKLGTGKTRLVQGLARGLGVPADVPVTSPTFTVLATYSQGRLPLYHFDLYRLDGPADLARIGAEEYLWGDGVCAVEWAERAPMMMPGDALWIEITYVGEAREFALSGTPELWKRPVAGLEIG